MDEQDKAVLQTLVTVAWADGTFTERERELLEALLESYGADDADKEELRRYASERRTLDDIPLTEMSAADRRLALQQAVVLTWIDGEQHQDEVQLLEQLREKLHIPAEEGQALIDAANARAKSLLPALSDEG